MKDEFIVGVDQGHPQGDKTNYWFLVPVLNKRKWYQKIIDFLLFKESDDYRLENYPFVWSDGDEQALDLSDGDSLVSIKHPFWPEKPWYVKVWKWITGLFIKPKFSKDALETVQSLYEPTDQRVEESIAEFYDALKKVSEENKRRNRETLERVINDLSNPDLSYHPIQEKQEIPSYEEREKMYLEELSKISKMNRERDPENDIMLEKMLRHNYGLEISSEELQAPNIPIK